MLNLLQTAERDDRVPLYAAMDHAIAAYDMAVADLEETRVTPNLQADIERVTGLRLRYGDALQETVEMIEIEGQAPARRHFKDKTQKALKALLSETQALEGKLQQVMQVELEQLKVAAANAVMANGTLAPISSPTAKAVITPQQPVWTIASSNVSS